MIRAGRLARAAILAFAAATAVAPLAALLRRSWPARVAVEGHSMEPTLRHGEWLLVDPAAFAEDAPAVGDLVLAHDPRAAGRLILKRVAATARDGTLTLAGDHPAHGPEPELGAVRLSAVVGRPWLRYRPLARFGRPR